MGWLNYRLLILVALGFWLAGVFAQTDINSNSDKSTSDDYGQVAYLHIKGPIDRIRHRYLQRALKTADEKNINTIIVHIDTDGGEVYYARQMLKLILDQPRAGRRTIAFVDFRAISAGALIAYGHQQLYISETATIGDIGVIFIKPGGEIEYAPEKIETVIRALLAQAAEQNGWNRAALLKMTARNQQLYRINLPDGSSEYVIEDDLPDFLARHPEIKKDNAQQVILYRGKDRLLTLTGREAVALNMASQLSSDLDALYQQLGIAKTAVLDLRPNIAELLASYLSTWAPLLAGLALLFIIFELKTPGVGLWALLGAAFAFLFLISQYTLNLIDNIEAILIVLGLSLVMVEFFTFAGAGLLGLAGTGLVFSGLILAFLPNELPIDFNDPRFVNALQSAAVQGLIAIVISSIGIVFFFATLPRSRLGRRLAIQAEVRANSSGTIEQSAATLLGQHGTARDSLRPGGVVIIDGQEHNARAEYSTYIAANQDIEVVAVEFGELIVRASTATEQTS